MAERSPGQKLVSVSLDNRLLELIDTARGYENRSHWIRRIISEELVELGHDVPKDLVEAPDRAGKGGSPTHKKSKVVKYKLSQAKPKKPKTQMVAEEGTFNGRRLGSRRRIKRERSDDSEDEKKA